MKQYLLTIITGLTIGSLVAVVGIYMYSQAAALVVTETTDKQVSQGPLITSEPIPHPLGNGTKVDLSISIINSSGDESMGLYAEKNLTDAGFTVEDTKYIPTRYTHSSLRYKPNKDTEARLLDEWSDGDWGPLDLHDDLEATYSYDAILTIGSLDEL